jgi:hypothetical protein
MPGSSAIISSSINSGLEGDLRSLESISPSPCGNPCVSCDSVTSCTLCHVPCPGPVPVAMAVAVSSLLCADEQGAGLAGSAGACY